MPVQRAVERDEIPYPWKSTTLRPLLNIMDSAPHNPVASLSSNPWVAEQQSVGPRVALIFKSIITLLIIFLGFIKSKPCWSQTIKVFKKCVNLHEIWTQIATIGVKIIQRVTTQPPLSLALLFTIQHVPCRRAVRVVGVACARWAWRH